MPRETRALSPNAVTQPLRRIPCSPQEPPFLEPPPFPISSSSVALRCFYLPPLLLPSISSAFSFSPLSSSLSLSLFFCLSHSRSQTHTLANGSSSFRSVKKLLTRRFIAGSLEV